MSEKKAVLFNIDDTIFDNRYSTREGLRLVWMRYPSFQEITIDQMEAEYLAIVEEMRFAHVIFGKLTPEEVRAEIFKLLFIKREPEIDFNTANNAAVMFRNKYVKIRRAVKGFDELVSALHGKYKISVVTNNSQSEAEDKLAFTGFDKFIDAVTTSEETGVGKPSARIFRIAMEKVGCAPEESVMIGSSWNWDILGAHELGIKCIWLNNYGRESHEGNIAAEVTSLEDTADIINLIEN